ncbi:MAG: hypothetical protein ACXAC6_15845 [Candidatus Hodarchaeales archaeon]|jgi:hypothetical protein
MVTQAEMHKQMIKTVSDKITPYIQLYASEDQILLHEFMNLIKDFEKAEIKRTELINDYGIYCKRLLGTKKYFETPFLWFAVSYIQKAQLTLNLADFKAVSFYEYLAKFLRKDSSYHGVFELVRKQTSLSDGKWEELQYASTKMLKPLTKEQMKIIEKMIRIIKNQGLYALDNRIVKKQLSELYPKGTKTEKVVNQVLTNLESKWNINFQSPAFGVERFFFHMNNLTSKIEQIIPYEDIKNSVLCLSNIYVSRENENNFLGILYVPTQDSKRLINYLQHHEERGILRLKELSRINTSYRGLSLERYRVDKGWQITNKAEFKKIYNLLTTNDIIEKKRNTQTESLRTHFTQKFNQKWNFTQHQLPVELIKVYSEIQPNYTISELPLPEVDEKRKKIFTKTNIGLLKQLMYNNIMNIDWIPWRLVFEYSLDFYWVTITKKYIKKAKHLLKIIPFSMVYATDEKLYVWLHLSPQLAKWIEKELKWQIVPISYYSQQKNYVFNWFDEEKLRWKTPKVLDSNNE